MKTKVVYSKLFGNRVWTSSHQPTSFLTNNCTLYYLSCLSYRWLAPMLLLIDLYEKAAVTARRKLAHKGASHVWKWFDDSTGRWCQYSNNNNKTIDDAYWAGRTSVRFTAARRRYVVHFNTMVQVSSETHKKKEQKRKRKMILTGVKSGFHPIFSFLIRCYLHFTVFTLCILFYEVHSLNPYIYNIYLLIVNRFST